MGNDNLSEKPVIMEYLSELIHAQMEDRIPQPLPKGVTLEELQETAKKGQICYLIFGALLKLDIPEADAEKMRPFVLNSTIKTLSQVCAVREIQEKLEENKIRHQVLKGAVMKHIYPRPEFREMGDIDNMIYEDSLEQAEKVVEELGFVKYQTVKHHEIFFKKPFLMLEMHWSLYDQNVDRNQSVYFKKQFRAEKKEGWQYSYEFSKEDFYVYLISHMAKHFYETGCGIRNLLDIYIYQNAYKATMDRRLVEEELRKCGLLNFEREMKNLSVIWLDNLAGDTFYNNLFEYMLDCGIYGKGENGVWGQLAKEITSDKINKRSVRMKYYFPALGYMKEHYAWLDKFPYMLPIAWTCRAFQGITRKGSMERKKYLERAEPENIEKVRMIYQRLHLNFKK